jgi:hypothetical protein
MLHVRLFDPFAFFRVAGAEVQNVGHAANIIIIYRVTVIFRYFAFNKITLFKHTQ